MDNHIIPVSNGLLDHRERIGPAIWEFLWCIDRVTGEEVDGDGTRWGLVLGGVPIKYDRIANDLKSSEQTVKRNLSILKDQNYVSSIRVARGQILRVAKNKKNVAVKRAKPDVQPPPSDSSKMDYHDEEIAQKWTITDERESKNGLSQHSDSSKMTYLKDFKDLITTTTNTNSESESRTENKNGFETLFAAYLSLHRKLDIHVKPPDVSLMTQMIANGIPVDLIIRVMTMVHAERTASGATINTFAYYKNAINEAWESSKSITDGVPSSSVAIGRTHNRGRNKQSKRNEDTARMIQEAIERERRDQEQRGT